MPIFELSMQLESAEHAPMVPSAALFSSELGSELDSSAATADGRTAGVLVCQLATRCAGLRTHGPIRDEQSGLASRDSESRPVDGSRVL